MKVKLTKLSDDVFNGSHPNGIYEGHVQIGTEYDKPELGQPYWVGRSWRTSDVIEVLDNNTFKTLNSTYKIEYINE